MENKSQKTPSILVFKNCVFSTRLISGDVASNSGTEKYELWEGRHRITNERLRAYIYFNPLHKSIVNEINKWIILGTYEITADKIIRYLDFFTTTSSIINGNKPVAVLIVQSIDNHVTLEAFLKTNLQICDQIKYFHQLVKMFYSLYGSGINNLSINSKNILWDSKSHNLKFFKDPIEIFSLLMGNREEKFQDINQKREFALCGEILKCLFSQNYRINLDKLEKKEIKLSYILKIIELYKSSETPPTPKDIFTVLNSFFTKIKDSYNSYNNTENKILQNVQLVGLLSIFKNINIPFPTEITNKNLVIELHNILPRIPQKSLELLSIHSFKIISALEGNKLSSNITSVNIENILSYHGVIKDIYQYENTINIIQYVVNNTADNEEKVIAKLLNKLQNNIYIAADVCDHTKNYNFSNSIDPFINIGILEDYRIWYRDQYLSNTQSNGSAKIHNILVKIILKVNKWFYDDFNIDSKKLFL